MPGEVMNLYLAGTSIMEPYFRTGEINAASVSALCSFYGISDFEKEYLSKFKRVIIDSGAFSFINGKRIGNWARYTEDYAAFINQYGIENFFELDIDSIVGLKEVERLRAMLERLTGKQPIPVWHKGRGKDYFLGMVKDYPYIALGGIAIKEIPRNIFEKSFPWFINKAHENNTKIHGLGYTSLPNLTKYHFDSVDSTTWNVGAKYGNVCQIKLGRGGVPDAHQKHRPGTRVINSRELAKFNFLQWIKAQQYAEKHL